MNEPKRRGRPPKARLLDSSQAAALSAAMVPVINGHKEPLQPLPTEERAQAYAMRVWAGQSESLGRGDRIARIEMALEGQGLSAAGIKYPGAADDDWTEEDEQPVIWRRGAA